MFCKTVEPLDTIKHEIVTNGQKIKQFLESTQNVHSHQLLFSGAVFVTFKDTIDHSAYSDIFPDSFLSYIFAYLHYIVAHYVFCCCYSQKKKTRLSKVLRMSVEVAPEPTDVIWENLEYSDSQRFRRTLLVYFITVLLVLANLCIIVLLDYLQVTIVSIYL